jgi:hypothetical protein
MTSIDLRLSPSSTRQRLDDETHLPLVLHRIAVNPDDVDHLVSLEPPAKNPRADAACTVGRLAHLGEDAMHELVLMHGDTNWSPSRADSTLPLNFEESRRSVDRAYQQSRLPV